MATLDQLTALGSDTFRRAVSWWLAELRGLLPGQLAGHPERAPAILEMSADRATLVLAKRGSARAAELPLRGIDPQEARSRVQSARQGRRLGDAVVIRLDQSVLLRSSITLPMAAERSLRSILQNQLERLVPLPADQICFQYRILSRSATAKTLNIELVTARRASIDDAVVLAKSVGLVPRVAIAAGGGTQRDAALVLWRAGRQSDESQGQRVLKRGLELATALLLVVAYGTYVYRLDERRNELQVELTRAAKAASVARDLVQQQTATESALVLLERRRKEPSPLALLNELTGLIPSSAWVSQLTLQKRSIELIGYSRRVSDFVPRINNSDSFFNFKFRSPTVLSPDGKGERFDISFDIWVEDTP
jgi:general secretion pathway protein L